MIQKILRRVLKDILSPLFAQYARIKYRRRLEIVDDSAPLNSDDSVGLNVSEFLNKMEYFTEKDYIIRFIDKKMWNDRFGLPLVRYKLPEDPRNMSYSSPAKYHLRESTFYVHSTSNKNDWSMFLWKDIGVNEYSVSFDVILESTFREFQVAFCYESLGKRLRFNLLDNSSLSFDIVDKGFFHNSLFRKEINFETGKSYNIELVVNSSMIIYLVDGIAILKIRHKLKLEHFGNGLAIICWDPFGKPIKCNFRIK